MKETYSNETVPYSYFEFPSFNYDEIGEIERVQTHFGITSRNFSKQFLQRARQGRIAKLSEDQWRILENTDSLEIQKGDWGLVAEHAEHQRPSRDWQLLKQRLLSKLPIDAPIIARRGDALHLVTGNTRLMVSRAMDIQPDVLIVDITDL